MSNCDFNKVALLSLLATLLKSHFGMGLLEICCIFSEHVFVTTTLEICF